MHISPKNTILLALMTFPPGVIKFGSTGQRRHEISFSSSRFFKTSSSRSLSR